MADNNEASLDSSGVPGLLGHSGTAGTAVTNKITTETTAGSIALHVYDLNSSGGGASSISSGTLETLGTLGTVEGVGTVTSVGQIHDAGTIAALPDIPGGTVDLITTVSAITNVSNITSGTLAQVTNISNLTGGTITSVEALPDLPGGTVDEVTNIAGGTITADHIITGISDGVKAVTNAGTAEALAASTSCKKIVLQASPSNTGYIAVGGTGVIAGTATSASGIQLTAGDTFVLQTDNLADIFIDATVSGEHAFFTYFT